VSVALRGEPNAVRHVKFLSLLKQGNANMKAITTANTRMAIQSSADFLPKALVPRILVFKTLVLKASPATCASLALAGLVGLFSASEAQAYSCGRSASGAGCIGSRGAVGVNRNGAVVVGRDGNIYAYHRSATCYWRNNQRICS
jgi:hypothetical protein